MSTYVYMRILESAPRRYDLGIRLLSLGQATAIYEAVAEAAVDGRRGARVLELGCGTGNLTRALLAHGALVTAVDQNPDMLEVAREKLGEADGRLAFREMAVVEIADRFPPESFDAVAATLLFSELSAEEQDYVLRAARGLLRPGGRLAVGDEVTPRGLFPRIGHALVRWPLAILTYLITQTTTSAVRELGPRVVGAGFRVIEERSLPGGAGLVVAERPVDASK